MKKINETKTLSDLLSSAQFKDIIDSSKIDIIAKHSTIFSFWADIVGKKFTNYTKPKSIKNNKLFVSAKSPVVIQELELYKDKLIKKINSYSKPLGIEIKDIVFNYKNFNDDNKQIEPFVEDKPVEINSTMLEEVQLADEDIFRKQIEKINFLTNEQKEQLLKKVISAQKAKIIRSKN